MEFKRAEKRKFATAASDFQAEIQATSAKEIILISSELKHQISKCSNDELNLLCDKFSSILSVGAPGTPGKKTSAPANKSEQQSLEFRRESDTEYVVTNREVHFRVEIRTGDRAIDIYSEPEGSPRDLLIKRNEIKLVYSKASSEKIRSVFPASDHGTIKRNVKKLAAQLLKFVIQAAKEQASEKGREEKGNPPQGDRSVILAKQIQVLRCFLAKPGRSKGRGAGIVIV